MQSRTNTIIAATLTASAAFGVFWLVNQDTASSTRAVSTSTTELATTTTVLPTTTVPPTTTTRPPTTTIPRPSAPKTTKPPQISVEPDVAFSQAFEGTQVALRKWYGRGGGTIDEKLKTLNQSLGRLENKFSYLGAKIRMSYKGDNPVWKVVLNGESRCMVEDLSGPKLILQPTSCSNY